MGVSLGGQVALDLIQQRPDSVDAALVSGASIHPPDDVAQWEMPHMPTDQEWLTIMTEDVQMMRMENAQNLQDASLSFNFEPQSSMPPVLVVIGEHDVAMARRDFEELTTLVKSGNSRSESKVLEGAWHNHPIDVPEHFADLIESWSRRMMESPEAA